MKQWITSLLAVLLAAGSTVLVHGRDVGRIYAENCANCHGANLAGGLGSSLIDDVWQYGGDDASIARSIRDGFPLNGMPAWKDMLTEAEIRAMVVLIREKTEEAKRRATVFASPGESQVVKSREHEFRVVTVADKLRNPWSMAFLPDGRMLVTEQPGTLRVVSNGNVSEPVAGTPSVRHRGQGGLLDVALHPGYSTNGWVYLSYSDAADASGRLSMTAVVRGRIKDHQWTDEQTIFRAPTNLYVPGNVHFGSRFVFDKGYLFFPIGERGHKEMAQDLARPNGKIHRVFDDGRIPADNPFVGRSNALPTIWSYGHRNPQGLAQHPATGDLWETEHGPRGGDELNLVRQGRNYGWPEITYGMDYNGSPISAFTAKEGMEQPVIHWTPSIAVCGIDFYRGDKFPRWKHDLFVTGLAQQELRRVVIREQKVVDQEVIFKNIGRVRHVLSGPDGYLYVALNGPDKIVRLEPATSESTQAAHATAAAARAQ